MTKQWAVPSNGSEIVSCCPVCGRDELNLTPIHLLLDRGVLVVGGWTLCTACGHSLHSGAPPEGFDPDAQASTGTPDFFVCEVCSYQDLRMVPVILSSSTGPRQVGEWGVCLSCGSSPYTNSEEEP